MRISAIVVENPGKESRLRSAKISRPLLRPGCLRIRVAATAVNRADLLQRRGLYPSPEGAPDILGLECSGVITEIAPDVDGRQLGDRVMALLEGGGYADEVVVPAGWVLPVPRELALEDAAAIPEAFLTAHSNIFMLGRLEAGQRALVHGGSGGVGTAAIQLIAEAGAFAAVTAGSAERCGKAVELGADAAIDYHSQALWKELAEAAGPEGFALILDCIGGSYTLEHLKLLGRGGRLVIIGLKGGRRAEIDLALLLSGGLEMIGSTLRGRPAHEKTEICRNFRRRFSEALDTGRIHPVIGARFKLSEAEDAHRLMQSGEYFGKIILIADSEIARAD